jgi:predicted amidohydrolase YtcJ
MLDRVDVHCIWVSNAVLELLPATLPEVPGGEIVTDPGPGVFCDNAMDLVTQYWPRPSAQKKTEFIKAAMAELNKVGLVGMHDAGVTPADLNLYESLVDGDSWTVRVYAMTECEKRNTFCPQDARMILRDDGLLSVRSVKLFAGKCLYLFTNKGEILTASDGALGSWGSAMLEPYSDRPSMTGSLLVNASTLTALANSWASEGYQVNIHAIGDLANRLAINAMEDVYKSLCPHETFEECQSRLRFRIEHAQIIHPDDQKRMKAAGIIPSIQPTHATSDMYYAEDRLGEKRTKEEAYRMRSVLPLNPVLGSDFPVEPPNPFEGIFAAVTRKSPKTGKGKDGDDKGWHVEEALTLDEALRGFTIAPAYAAFLEGRAGVIQKGAFGDWVVLDHRIDLVKGDDLKNIEVRETWIKGRRVYQHPKHTKTWRERLNGVYEVLRTVY